MILLSDLLSWPNLAVALIGSIVAFAILMAQHWHASIERSHVDTQEKLMEAARTLTSGGLWEFSSYNLGVAVEEIYNGQVLSYGGLFRALSALEQRGDLLSRWQDQEKPLLRRKLYRLRVYG